LHSNKITVAVRFGGRLCVRMALFFDGIALVLGVALRDWIVSISALVSLFLFGWLIFRHNPVWINRATRLPILVLSVLVAVYFPPYWLGIYWAGPIENGIHGQPINPDGSIVWAGWLGRPITFGCMMLRTDHARWLYSWADVGTPVVIRP